MTTPAPEPRSALTLALRAGHSGAEGMTGVSLAERRVAIVQVQSRKGQEQELTSALHSAIGLSLPGPGQSSTGGELAAIWIAPGAWLVLAPLIAPGELARRLAVAASDHASISDQTFGKTVLRLSGLRSRDVLAKGCRIDLHPRVFGPGRAGVSAIAHIGCVVVQVDEAPTFDLVVPSTLAQSFLEWLEVSAAEFGYEVLAGG